MATTLVMSGSIGSEHHEVQCGAEGMSGSESVIAWIEQEMAEPYSPDAIRTFAPALTRLFGASLRLSEQDELPLVLAGTSPAEEETLEAPLSPPAEEETTLPEEEPAVPPTEGETAPAGA